MMESIIKPGEEIPVQIGISTMLGTLGQNYLALGDYSQAKLMADAAVRIGKETGDTASEPELLPLQAMIASVVEDDTLEMVKEKFEYAISRSTTASARPILGQAHFRYAEALHKWEQWEGSEKQLTKAEALFADMGMMWWPDQAKTLRKRIEARTPWKGFAPYAV